MPVAIRTQSVRDALRPRLGSAMVEGCDVADRAAGALRGYAPYRDTLEDLSQRLCNVLFDCLYGILGPGMTVRLDDGRMQRIHMRELPEIADDIMGALFDEMTVYSVTYNTLKEYAMRTGSLSAMRVLYQKYDEFHSAEEKGLIARILRDNAPERASAWLGDE